MCMCEKNIMTLCVSEKLINKNHRTILIVVSTINKKNIYIIFLEFTCLVFLVALNLIPN